MAKSIMTVDINISISELDEFKQMIDLNLELHKALRGLEGETPITNQDLEAWAKSLTSKKEK